MQFDENTALKLCEICKIYGQGETTVEALKDVNISFRKNEFVSILGPSGCGKTTLLNIVGGLDRYTSGDLMINGVSTKQYKDGDWDTYRNNSIGFVFQNYNLIPHQTVLSNVELALTLSGVSKQERQKRALTVLEKVGLKDQAKKLPGQMSGGQMQRVAIARALVNDPKIILADEPTGALDTETSVQILELLKEVANDRLVIMVTHNPELAKTYSTRIINLLDGRVVGDTNPLVEKSEESIKEENAQTLTDKEVKKKKSAMRFTTALALSMSNLRAKKARTILTSIAGSIGIIGIALVLAVSTGFSTYVNKMQADTLSVYPITIAESAIDLTDFEKLANATVTNEMLNQKVKQEVYASPMFNSLSNMLKSNLLEKEYAKQNDMTYLEFAQKYVDDKNAEIEDENEWKYCLQKSYMLNVENYIYSEMTYNLGATDATKAKHVMSIDAFIDNFEAMFSASLSSAGMPSSMVRTYIPTITEIPNNLNIIKAQYDLIDEGGRFPENKNEMLLVVDSYNRVNDITLAFLGISSIEKIDVSNGSANISFSQKESWTFDEIKQKEFYYIDNTTRYVQMSEDTFADKMYTLEDEKVVDNVVEKVPNDAEKMKIVGVVRLKDNVKQGVLDPGLAYTTALTEHILNDQNNVNSTIVQKAKNSPISMVNVANSCNYLSYAMASMIPGATPTLKTEPITARGLAGDKTVSKISIYSVDYESKEQLKAHLNTWNDVIDEKDDNDLVHKVHFSDSTDMLFSALNSIVDAVKIALVCFTSISLIVSSIMIGIITYVSVVERTKEIGILRSIGARKKDISRIFNAETFLIGLCAGIIGVVFTYLISIPINLIVASLMEGIGNIASLQFGSALILVAVSFILTLIAGIIPSRIAAKKDPVVALRNE